MVSGLSLMVRVSFYKGVPEVFRLVGVIRDLVFQVLVHVKSFGLLIESFQSFSWMATVA